MPSTYIIALALDFNAQLETLSPTRRTNGPPRVLEENLGVLLTFVMGKWVNAVVSLWWMIWLGGGRRVDGGRQRTSRVNPRGDFGKVGVGDKSAPELLMGILVLSTSTKTFVGRIAHGVRHASDSFYHSILTKDNDRAQLMLVRSFGFGWGVCQLAETFSVILPSRTITRIWYSADEVRLGLGCHGFNPGYGINLQLNGGYMHHKARIRDKLFTNVFNNTATYRGPPSSPDGVSGDRTDFVRHGFFNAVALLKRSTFDTGVYGASHLRLFWSSGSLFNNGHQSRISQATPCLGLSSRYGLHVMSFSVPVTYTHT
ncbi:hypothetical protein BDN72DRAFT_865201 [Pluteus cervinus]|uniref:Uncharacterized protein n=1 Tax=Pluteus cervinus TaxID=181527 RepID=A0ACD3A124_9AGAR|nr:hypothetical protein BDN72DRAFT_865201 [Pluteus cervinus]